MDRQSASATRADLEFMLINEAAEPKPLPFSLLADITNGFCEEQEIGSGGSAKVYKGYIGNRTVAVKKLSIPYLHEKEFNQEIECLMKVKHENVVRFLGYCSDTQGSMWTLNGKHVMADVQERLLCFEYLPTGSLDKYITDPSCGLEWTQRYNIITGVCHGLHRLHEDHILHLDLKPGNILLGDNMVPKLADFGLSRCLDENQSKVFTENIGGTMGYLAPEYRGGVITDKFDLYSLGVIIMEILTGCRGLYGSHVVDNVLETWINRLGESRTNTHLDQIKVCAQIGIECSDINPDNRPDMKHIIVRLGKTESTQETQESDKQLHVQPTVLLFDLQLRKLIPCLLQLTNDTDEHMAFKLTTTEIVDWSEHFMARLPLYGIVPARSTYTLILTVFEWAVPDKRFCDLILESCISVFNHIRKFRDIPECEQLFKVWKKGKAVHEVKLKAFLSQKGQSSKPIGPGIRIVSMEKPWKTLYSVDAHPTKPWIITGHACGHVRIWNHETQSLVNSFKVSQGSVYSVKFIARKQWFISSSAEGLVHVYSYEKNMQKITSFRARDGHISLAVHPTQPYVLSWRCLGHDNSDDRKKLWDWEKGWECVQTFEGKCYGVDFVCQVVFDPKETNRFACTSSLAVEVCSLDTPDTNYTLPYVYYPNVKFLEFFTRGDQQYLITSHDMTAMIWDLQNKKYVTNNLQTLMSPIDSVFSHPSLPILLTCSSDGSSHFWNNKDFRLEGVLDYGCGGDVKGVASLMGSKRRFVIGQESSLTILDIDNEKYQNNSRESSEPQLCADTRQDTNSEVITQGSNELLHVHPLKLHFHFQAQKSIMCSLHLTNNTDKHVAFRLSVEEGVVWLQQPFTKMPLSGIVPSRSTYTLVVTMSEIPNLLQEQNFNLILQSSISGDKFIYAFIDQSECDLYFEDAKKTGNTVHEVKLKAVLSLQGQAMSENGSTGEHIIQPSVNIWGLFHPAKDFSDVLRSLDADPIESRIITSHRNGDVSIWNCGTQRMMSSVNTWEGTGLPQIHSSQHDVYSVKFITRRQWLVAATCDGFVHVYDYATRMEFIKRFKVSPYCTTDGDIYLSRALVIHPTQSYMLSTYGRMKLWDWDKDWKCIEVFNYVFTIRQVAFNPKDTNTFATASTNKIKLWSLYSPTCEYTLHGHSGNVNCLEFITCYGQQYLITGSEDCTAKIWDLQEKTCVHTIDVFMSPVVSVISLPDTPYLITGSEDGTVCLWSRDSFRLERIFNIACSGSVQSLGLMGTNRVVIEQVGQISIMDIDTISKTSSTTPSNELIRVDPPELRLPVVQEVSSTLKISNITKHYVAFSIWSFNDMAEYNAVPTKGVLLPQSTLQVVVTRVARAWVPAGLMHGEVVFVKGIVVVEGLKTTDVTYDMFKPKKGQTVHEVELDVFFVASEIISKVMLPWTLDVHPTKPWIMMTQGNYHIHIWNYETREMKPIAIKGREVTSAKFIACKKWIMAGCSSGLIYVYSYDPVNKNPVKKIRSLQRHSESVNSLSVHATQPYVLSASKDGKIFIWNYENDWELVKMFHAKSLSVEHIEFNDNGNDWKLMKTVHAKRLSVEHVAFNPKDTNMFASAQDKTVKIWDLHSGEYKLILSGHSDLVVCLDYFSLGDKLYLITGSQDTTAKIWDCEEGRCVQTLKGHTDVVKIACCHPDLLILITGSCDGSVRLWDSTTFRNEETFNFGLGEVYAIACLKGSTRIAIGNEKGLSLLDIDPENKKGRPVKSIVAVIGSKKHKDQMIEKISSSELVKVDPLELRFPVAPTVSSTLKIHNITDYHVAFSICSNKNTARCTILPSIGVLLPQSMQEVLVTFFFRGKQKSFNPKEIVTVKSTIVKNLTTTYVTDDMFKTRMGRNVHHVELAIVFLASKIIYKVKLVSTIDVHPTNPWMLITQGDKCFRMHYRTQEVKLVELKEGEVTLAKFIARKRQIIVGSTSGLLYVYSCDSRKTIRVLRKHSTSIKSLAIHETESYVLSASSDGKILLWDYEKGWYLMKTFDAGCRSRYAYTGDIEHVAFNPKDTNMFASAQKETVKIWNLQSGECKNILFIHSDSVVCFNYFILGDKLYLITGSQDKTAKIWDYERVTCIKTLKGHKDVVKTACCHPDLPILITGSWDGSVRLWDSTTFRLGRILDFKLGKVNSIACLKGSTRIAIGHENGLVLADIGPEESSACIIRPSLVLEQTNSNSPSVTLQEAAKRHIESNQQLCLPEREHGPITRRRWAAKPNNKIGIASQDIVDSDGITSEEEYNESYGIVPQDLDGSYGIVPQDLDESGGIAPQDLESHGIAPQDLDGSDGIASQDPDDSNGIASQEDSYEADGIASQDPDDSNGIASQEDSYEADGIASQEDYDGIASEQDSNESGGIASEEDFNDSDGIVSQDSLRLNLRKQGYEVKQLRDLNKLRGKLYIYGLENVKSMEEALEANLSSKEGLIQLTLEWAENERCSPEAEADVLEGMCPPMGLETLNIYGYEGSRYPNWMVGKQNGGPKYLQKLCLNGWSQLGPAPRLEAFPCLRQLKLAVCSFDALPDTMEHLTSLKRLEIFYCKNMRSLPTLPQSLEVFILRARDVFTGFCEAVGHPCWQKIKHIPKKDIDGFSFFSSSDSDDSQELEKFDHNPHCASPSDDLLARELNASAS